MLFPPVTAKNLEHRSYDLPEDFESEYNVVVLAFTMEHQYDVEQWMPLLNHLKQMFSINVYELPTITFGTWIERRLLDYWMVTGIPDPAVRAATITLYLDVPKFIQALALPDAKKIYTLIVDRQGKVYTRIDGAYSPEKGDQLKKALKSLFSI